MTWAFAAGGILILLVLGLQLWGEIQHSLMQVLP